MSLASIIDWIFAYSGHIVLVGFSLTFIVIIIWAYRPSQRAALETHRNIPFKEAE